MPYPDGVLTSGGCFDTLAASMFLQFLLSSPMFAFAWVLAILLSLTVHEFSHALVGRVRGDKTAEREGRLTLNPLSHIDPFGFIAMLLFGFGWAKPVPFNPYNLKNPKWDAVAIALAGPASNLIIAAIAAIAIRVLVGTQVITELNLLIIFLFLVLLLNLFLMFFNIIPVHPLDGSKLFFALFDAPKYARARAWLLQWGPNVLFALVMISIISNFDVFFFVSLPAYATCDALLGESCGAFFGAILSTI